VHPCPSAANFQVQFIEISNPYTWNELNRATDGHGCTRIGNEPDGGRNWLRLRGLEGLREPDSWGRSIELHLHSASCGRGELIGCATAVTAMQSRVIRADFIRHAASSRQGRAHLSASSEDAGRDASGHEGASACFRCAWLPGCPVGPARSLR